jgi:Pyruvate/2-oxoacid:ferredoxin oxidoreductase delta subunit
MATEESSAPHAHPSTEEQDHPHACLNCYVYLGYTAIDEETGEEVERVEALPCRRCAEETR